MTLRLVAVSFDAEDPGGLAAFWAGVLGREIVGEPSSSLLPGDDSQVGLRFVAATEERSGKHRLHLHLTSSSLDDQRHTVETVLGLGGSLVRERPEDGYIIVGDPGGNHFCVIEPDNNFLADCGYLGEVTCDGTREVGLFWSDALGWPLVWDQDEETAIQSPRGGTKISWGGPPVAPKDGRNRQRFDLAASDLAAEVERLVALGATELGDWGTGVELADPDGNEFSISPA